MPRGRCGRRSSTSRGCSSATRRGHALLLHGKADGRGGFSVAHHAPSSQAAVDADAVAGRRRERRRGALSGDGGRQLDSDPDARARRQGCARRCGRGPLGRDQGHGRPARSCERAGGDALPARARRPGDGSPAPGLRGAAARAARVPAPPRRAPRAQRRCGARGPGGARRALAAGAGCRSSSPATSAGRSRRSPRISSAPRRCSGC